MDRAAVLREQELASIRVQRDNDLVDSVLKSLDERGRAQELVREQYSGRYPFELLQNANDAALGTGTPGRVRFLLTDSAVIVADNGSGFGDSQVDAICSLGRSSKGPGTAVGYKGLGFKSVGEIAERPQVTSAIASFQFDGGQVREAVEALLGELPTSQRFPIYAFPFPVDEQDLGDDSDAVQSLRADGFTTVIRLPFRKDTTREIVEDDLISNLQSRLLLFLPNVDHLELRGTRTDFSAEVSRDPEGSAEHVLLETNGSTEEWLIYRGTTIPERSVLEPMGEAWTKVEQTRFAVAVPIDETGQPQVSETFPLHVYFPTEERPGLHVAVHAEWALSMDRRHLAATPEATPYNRMLLQAVADFLRDQVAQDLVRRTTASAAAVEALVPAVGAPSGAGGSLLRSAWTEALTETCFLPTVGGQLRAPADVRLLPRSLPDIEAAHVRAVLDHDHTLRSDVEELASVATFLASVAAADEMSVGEFLSLLTSPTRETAGDYYAFLGGWRAAAGPAILAALKPTECVLTVDGKLLRPQSDTIFFPRERGDVALPEDLPVPIAYVPDVEGARELLRDLGVKPFEWRDLIRDFLIKILADSDADPEQRRSALDGLRAYHAVRLSGNEDLNPSLGRVLLPARSADRAEHQLRPAAEIYFGADWTGSDELEVIYGPFGEAEFLNVDVPTDPEARRQAMSFYEMLGAQDHPRLDDVTATDYSGGYLVGSGRHPHRGPLFSEWMALPAIAHGAALCPQGHTQSQQLRRSVRLDRHEQLVASGDHSRLMALWYQLAVRWGSVYEDAMGAVFYCVHGSHVGERSRWAPSLFAHTLRSRAWVPVDHGGHPELVRPEQAWIEATQTPRRIQERIPRISEAMFSARGGVALAAALGLTDAGRPRVADLLLLLESIADEAGARGTSRDIDQAARWVQRTLHDVLRDDAVPHPAPETVRLLASQDAVTMFVAQPPYADDPLLRDTFEQRRPLLSAEAGLNKLARYFGLIKLDDAVQTLALPYGEHHDELYDAVNKRIRAIKPYLFSLVRAENSSAERRVRAALRNLDLVVCDQLVLTYEYDGTTVQREDAVCYIANRQERRGRRPFNVGTAYLELDPKTNEPHWFPLGRLLAQHLNVPTLADAFTMLLTAAQDDRKRMMADRQIGLEDINESRSLLRQAGEDDDDLANVLDSLVPSADQNPSIAAFDRNGTVSVTLPLPQPVEDQGDGPASDGPGSHGPGETPNQPPAGPPPVDYEAVKVVDAKPGPALVPSQATPPGGGGGSWRPTLAPAIQTDEENRRIGRRGEETVYYAERIRLKGLGKNPDSVHWVSKVNETSPYDLTSVDADDQLIYIEVKSTKSNDPTEAFYISHAELLEAVLRRSRYYIYRVTNVDANVPTITRWGDPLGLIGEHKGTLLLANARMTLTAQDGDNHD
jgi:hypothetical protein